MAKNRKISEATRNLVDLVRHSVVVEPINTNKKPIEIYTLNNKGKYKPVKDVENTYTN